jgi:hypothetical protein
MGRLLSMSTRNQGEPVYSLPSTASFSARSKAKTESITNVVRFSAVCGQPRGTPWMSRR